MAWTQRHAHLLATLYAEWIPGLRATLSLSGPGSAQDVALLALLDAEPATQGWVEDIAHNQRRALRERIASRYPRHLPAQVVHHLALAWLEGGDDRARVQGVRGLFALWTHARPYLFEIALAAAGHASEAERALASLPTRLCEDWLEAVRMWGRQPEAATAAWRQLEALEKAVLGDGSEAAWKQVQPPLQAARETAVDEVISLCRAQVGLADGVASVSGGRQGAAKGSAPFAPALALFRALGGDEELGVALLKLALELLWPLHNDDAIAAMKRIIGPMVPVANDLERRLLAGGAFGQQALFGDFCVMAAFALGRSPQDLLLQEKWLRRSLGCCATHRNTRRALATCLIHQVVGDLKTGGWLPGKEQAQRLAQAEQRVDEAAALFPGHPRLLEVRTLLAARRSVAP